MKRIVLAWIILVAVTATHCFAAEPAVDGASEPVIPEREFKFEVSEEEFPIRTYPQLLDLRYVAVVRFNIHGAPASSRALPSELGRLLGGAYRGTLTRPYSTFRTEARMVERWVLPSLVDNMPQQRQLPKDVVSLFATPAESNRFLNTVGSKRIDETLWLQIEVRAATIERAKELASGLISLYDYGLVYPIQKELARLEQVAQASLVQHRAALEQATQALAVLEEQLAGMKEYEDITQESLVSFITQLRLISVDLAGIAARIEACNKILAKRGSPSQMENVEAVKITAEIELVGVAARKAAIEEIVEKGRLRVELLGKVEAAGKTLHDRKARVSGYERKIAEYEEARERLTPFPIQDGKVTIHPIKWGSTGR